jgi:hypothetical protein
MEPLVATKITLSGLSIFASLITGSVRAYQAYKLSAAFGEDWVAADRRLFIQRAKLQALSQAKLAWFKNDLGNEEDDLTRAIRAQLIEIYGHFKKCGELMKKYHDIGESDLFWRPCEARIWVW